MKADLAARPASNALAMTRAVPLKQTPHPQCRISEARLHAYRRKPIVDPELRVSPRVLCPPGSLLPSGDLAQPGRLLCLKAHQLARVWVGEGQAAGPQAQRPLGQGRAVHEQK